MASDKQLVYHYRGTTAESSPVVSNGLAIISASELDTILKERKSNRSAHVSFTCGN